MAVGSTHAATIIAAAELIKEEKRSYIMKKIWFLLMFVMVLAAMPSAFASGTVTATGTSCPTNSTYVGYTTVNWTITAGEPNNVALWANYFNSNLTIIGQGIVSESRNGSSYYPYLSYGFQYDFTLESGEDASYDYNSGNGVAGTTVQC
jgi:hypothetical protein